MTTPPLKIFHFKAAMADGSVTTGQLSASDRAQAITLLQRSGARPLRLQTRPVQESWLHRDIGWGGARRLSDRDAAQFCRELQVSVGAGLELSDALLSMLASGQRGARSARFAATVLQGIQLGKGFAVAVAESGFRVPADLVPVLHAGEEAGALPLALKALAEAIGQRGKLAGDVLSALAYPAFLLAMVSIVLGILATFVAPALGRLFLSMDRPPPAVIALLWNGSEFAAANWVPLSVATLAGLAGLVIFVRSKPGRNAIHAVSRKLPVVGGILVWSATARFASALKLSVATNVAMAPALERSLSASGAVGSAAIARTVEHVRRGSTLHQTLTALGVLPPKALHLIGIGERNGRLGEVLGIVIEDARAQTERRTALITNLLGPILIVVIGLVVGLTGYSIFSALMEINSLAS